MSKELIKRKNNIFNKIRNFIFKISNKSKNIGQEKIEVKNYEQEKREILELYNKVKNREVDIYSISEDKIEMINELLKAEIDLENERIDKIKIEVRKIQNETEKIEYTTKTVEAKTEMYKKLIEENFTKRASQENS